MLALAAPCIHAFATGKPKAFGRLAIQNFATRFVFILRFNNRHVFRPKRRKFSCTSAKTCEFEFFRAQCCVPGMRRPWNGALRGRFLPPYITESRVARSRAFGPLPRASTPQIKTPIEHEPNVPHAPQYQIGARERRPGTTRKKKETAHIQETSLTLTQKGDEPTGSSHSFFTLPELISYF